MADNIMIPEHLYIHGTEINQFLYIQVPLLLVKDKVFSNVSDSAKILYGLLLNRMGLSISNGWMDENNRTYINYTIENIMEDFGCGHTKASGLFRELTNINDTGIGLIEKVRVLNKPSRIYVLNFMEVLQYLSMHVSSGERNEIENIDCEKTSNKQDNSKCGRRTAANADDGQPQMRTTDNRGCGRRTAANADENYNYPNYNYYRNHNQSVNQHEQATPSGSVSGKSDTDVSQNMTEGLTEIQPIKSSYEDLEEGVLYSVDQLQDFFPYTELRQLLTYHHFVEECEKFKLTQLERKQRATEELKTLIDYPTLKQEPRADMNLVDALLDYMTEVIATKECLTIKNITYEADMMGNRFFGMDMFTILHVLEKINTFSSKNRIGNTKHYYIKCLLSAKSDMHTNVTSQVNYDMAHWNATDT